MMKQADHKHAKHHSLFTIPLAAVAIVAVILLPDAALFIGLGFMGLYIAGNGLIHHKKGTLNRDAFIEYAILVLVALVLLGGLFFNR